MGTEKRLRKTDELNNWQYYGYTLWHFKSFSSVFSGSLLYPGLSAQAISLFCFALDGAAGMFISNARYNIDDWLLSCCCFASLCCFDKRMGIKLTKTVANENEKMLRKEIAKRSGRSGAKRGAAGSKCANPLTRN